MVLYRRSRLAGQSYFFTLGLQDRSASTLTDHIGLLGLAIRVAKARRPFVMTAIVVLPDHLHCIWKLPDDDSDFPARWRAVKAGFTHQLLQIGIGLPKRAEGGYALWQRRFWEHRLRDEDDLARHLDYIHFNPVKHGWANRAADWPHSSFQRHVAMGHYEPDWGLAIDAPGDFGEA